MYLGRRSCAVPSLRPTSPYSGRAELVGLLIAYRNKRARARRNSGKADNTQPDRADDSDTDVLACPRTLTRTLTRLHMPHMWYLSTGE